MRFRIGIVSAACLAFAAVPAQAMAAPAATKPPVKAKVVQKRIARVVLTSFEAQLLTDVNAARASRGLAKVRVTSGATGVARRWAARMSKTGVLAHNPNYSAQLIAAGSRNWRWMAENVAYASADDAHAMFKMYMNSPGHRANILNPKARVIGIGVAVSNASWGPVAWNAMNFSDA